MSEKWSWEDEGENWIFGMYSMQKSNFPKNAESRAGGQAGDLLIIYMFCSEEKAVEFSFWSPNFIFFIYLNFNEHEMWIN